MESHTCPECGTTLTQKPKGRTLAECSYDSDNSPGELFDTIHYILGGAPLDQCANDGFVWPCEDTWSDGYDCSVEVVLHASSPPLTRDQADKILALGFGQIYESPAGVNWTKDNQGPCSTREAYGGGLEKSALRAKLKAAEEKIAQLEKL